MITFSDVTVTFSEFTALPEFSLTVQEGEFFTLLGPSGCGKTTALRTLAGLTAPSSGTITIDGADVTRLRSDQRHLGMVFQNYALFPSMSVEENIGFGLKTQRVKAAEVAERVRRIAAEVDLRPEQLTKNVSELSGGQQQRVAIARSLILRPKILLLDEPLSNLDAKLRHQLRQQLKDLQQHFGITTVYVTHDQDEALAMSDRIAVMNGGRIEQIGTPEEVYARSASEFVCTFIGEANRLTPAMVAHLRATAHRDAALDADAATYLRLEKSMLLGPDQASPLPAVDGTVVGRVYHGTDSTYTVDCGDLGRLRAIVREDGATSYDVGRRVRVGVPTEHLLQYPTSTPPVRETAAVA
ncbi:ABC transporter ATP-binding protein [Microbacterium esteraromaticum]|uniref:ABC transporter ATP-binding protein n=1 Tax=Microbacterium esteraromaticum TaxID=57043 RepID=UPI001CD5C9F7|nr:ABC transporter ATP-binding protein [Microbacterium esteraromaticum]MCA1306918.1 ABC transporter ATP-binding protein [Microbacterium esteraromaticum]